jgi:hypothetical protein
MKISENLEVITYTISVPGGISLEQFVVPFCRTGKSLGLIYQMSNKKNKKEL